MQREVRIIAAILALAAFAVAVVAGLSAGNPAHTVLLRALGAMLGANIIGVGLSWVLSHVFESHQAAYRAANPVPSIDLSGVPAPGVVSEAAPAPRTPPER